MKSRLALSALLIVNLSSPLLAGESLSQSDLLLRMIDLNRLSQPPAAGETTLVFSSANQPAAQSQSATSSPAIPSNPASTGTDQGWELLAAIDGPGVIWRIWSDNPTGRIRFELDGAKTLECEFLALFQGNPSLFGEPFAYRTSATGGYDLCFPIGFAKRGRVLTQGFSSHYQIDATRFAADTQVATFKRSMDEPARKTAERVKKVLTKGLTDREMLAGLKTRTEGQQQEVAKNEKLTWDVDAPGTIRRIYVMLTDAHSPRENYFWHNIIFRAFWDGHTEPDIEAPACDLFGSGFNRRSFKGLVQGTDLLTDEPFETAGEAWALYSYFPMPIFKSARFELENRTGRTAGLMLQMWIENGPPPATALQFRARFRRDDPANGPEFTLLETPGRGRLVGCTYNVDTPVAGWWGDGNAVLTLDGAATPQIRSAGAAGFFGDAAPWTFFGRRFHAVTSTGPYGKYSAVRLLLADAVNFQNGLKFTMENRAAAGAQPADDKRYVSSVACWYGEPNAPLSLPRMKPEDLELPGLRMPNAIEVESTVQKLPSAALLREKSEVGVEFSGGAAVRVDPSATLNVVLKSDTERRVRLRVRLHPGRQFEQFELLGPGDTPVGQVLYQRGSDGLYDIGEVLLKAGDNAFKLRGKGQPVLDCWILEPLP